MQHGFLGLGPFRKDVDDDFLAVDDADLGNGFPVALLGGGELVVENEHVGFEFLGLFEDFLHLALSEQVGGVGLAEFDDQFLGDGYVEVRSEFLQLVKQVVGFLAAHLGVLNSDQNGLLYFLAILF